MAPKDMQTDKDEEEKKQKEIDWYLFGKTGFFACLNFADFFTDILVLLQFGCMFGTPLKTNCDIPDVILASSNVSATGDEDTCQVHVWWLAISATILLCSSVGSAFFYSTKARREGNPELKTVAFAISFVMALLQLAPFMDLIHMLRHGKKFMDNEKKQHILWRDLVIKLVESAPQAFFQTYVLFAIEAHDQPLRVLSLVFSIASLSLSLALALPELYTAEDLAYADPVAKNPSGQCEEQYNDDEEGDIENRSRSAGNVHRSILLAAKEVKTRRSARGKSYVAQEGPIYSPTKVVGSPLHESKIAKLIFWIYLASDTLVRSGGYAVVFSASLRSAGFPMAVTFALCQLILSFWTEFTIFLKLVRMGVKSIPAVARGIKDSFVGLFHALADILGSNDHGRHEDFDSGRPQDWDLECAKMCSLCFPCVKWTVKIAYVFIAAPIGFAVGAVVLLFVLAIALLAASPIIAVVATLVALIIASFAIAMTSVPVVLTFPRPAREKVAFASVRILEYLSFGFVLLVFGQTTCGGALAWETQAFFIALGSNVATLLVLVALGYSLQRVVDWEQKWSKRFGFGAKDGQKSGACLCAPMWCCSKGQRMLDTE